MTPNDTIRLLILNDSRKEAERLISMLHNAGRQTRAQHVESEEILTKLLQEQSWDLLIGHASTRSVPPQLAVKHIKRLSKDVPVILQTDEPGSHAVVEGMKLGAVDVVQLDEDQHLLLVIQREMESHEQRKLRRRADRKFLEAERRSQHLLDSSRDAIAYVQDGMYLYANESFAEMFGYDDRDDIECMPIIDMIDGSDQDKVKAFLKEFTLKGDDSETTTLEFKGLTNDGKVSPVKVEVINAIYDEEPCIQFIAKAASAGAAVNNEALEAQLAEIKYQDGATGLYNRQYLVNRLQQCVNSTEGADSSALLTIEVDNFADRVQSVVGVAGSDMVLKEIAKVLKQISGRSLLARFGDHSFSILAQKITADKAVAVASKICSTLAEHIIDVDGRTMQCTLSIGVALINDTSSNAETVIEQSMNALTAVREAGSGGTGNGAKLFEPKISADEDTNMGAMVKAALEKNRFKLLFQPIISLRGSEDENYEVLLRMVSDDGEDISPYKFLDAIKDSATNIKIDRWVILESIKKLSPQIKKHPKTQLIINLTKYSMSDEGFVPWLGVAIKAAGVPAKALTFQVSEADVTNHLNAAKAFAETAKKAGFGTSISNFGCSLNPFTTLKHVATGHIKIDGSFTTDVQSNNGSPEALVNLLKELHEEEKVTIVPFVENASVLPTLWQAGAHYIQGHYLQAPAEEMNYDFSTET